MNEQEEIRIRIGGLLEEFTADGMFQLQEIVFERYYTKITIATKINTPLEFVKQPYDLLSCFIVPEMHEVTGFHSNDLNIPDLFEIIGLDPNTLPIASGSGFNEIPLIMRQIKNNWPLLEKALSKENIYGTLKNFYNFKIKEIEKHEKRI